MLKIGLLRFFVNEGEFREVKEQLMRTKDFQEEFDTLFRAFSKDSQATLMQPDESQGLTQNAPKLDS